MSTQSKSTKSSSSSLSAATSDRNKNLLAAKSVLGLIDVASNAVDANASNNDTLSSTTTAVKSDANSTPGSSLTDLSTSSTTCSPTLARARDITRTVVNPSRSVASASPSRSLRTTATVTTRTSSSSTTTKTAPSTNRSSGSKHSLVHSLSDTARFEARRHSVDGGYDQIRSSKNNSAVTFAYLPQNSGGSSERRSLRGDVDSSKAKSVVDYVSQTSGESERKSLASSSSLSIPSSRTSKATSRDDNNRMPSDGSIYDVSTLEEGSEYDSLTAKPFATHTTRESIRKSLLHNTSSTSFSEGTASSSRSSITIGRRSRINNNNNNNSISSSNTLNSPRIRESVTTNSSQLSEVSSNSVFVPQRFEEVRSLLMAVTPLQLEGLLREIFENSYGNNDNHPSSSTSRQLLPKGWKGTAKKSKSRGFRKDAYLAELTLDEIKRYTSDKNIHGMEECATREEAMDLIAFEFEHLVSGIGSGSSLHESGSTSSSFMDRHYENEGQDQIYQGSFMSNHDSAIQSLSSSFVESQTNDNSMENSNTTINITNEMTNLRSTLRACTLPELRFVAERMELDVDTTNRLNKSELILLIENSVPGMMSELEQDSTTVGNSVVSDSTPRRMHEKYSMSQNQTHDDEAGDSQMTNNNYYQNVPQNEEIYYDDNYYSTREGGSKHRRVQFSNDSKRDTSHMTPQGSWKHNSPTDYHDIEHGYDDEDDNDNEDPKPVREKAQRKRKKDGKKKKRRPASRMRPSSSISESIRNIKSLELSSLSKNPWKVGGVLLLIIALAIGLSVGFTRKDSNSAEDGDLSNPFITDPSDPFFQKQLNEGTKTVMPSARPSVKTTDIYEGVSPPTEDALAALFSSPSAMPELNSVAPTSSTSTLDLLSASQSPVVPIKVGIITNSPTLLDAAGSHPPTHSPSATVTTVTTADVANTATLAPTVPYPLLGPFDESGMRIILYGVSELSDDGSTQWEMLTAAFINQFFNNDVKGEDAVQNIVFDVVASVGIKRTDEWNAGRRSVRERQGGSTSAGVIITFTTTLSYRSLSSGIDTKTIAEHPFLDEEIRLQYFNWLIDNNAVAHIGQILGISPVFYGDDFPDTPSLAVTTTLAPSQSSAQNLPEVSFPIMEHSPTQFPTTVVDSSAPSAMQMVTQEPTFQTNAVTSEPSLLLPEQEATLHPATLSQPAAVVSLTPTVLTNSVTSEPSLLLSEQEPTNYPVSLIPSTSVVNTPEPSPSITDMLTLEPTPLLSGKGTLTPSSTSATTTFPSPLLPVSERPSLSIKPSSESSGGSTIVNTYSPVGSPRSTGAYVITSDPTATKFAKRLTESCEEFPTTDPICPLLAEYECCQPMCAWDSSSIRCSFADESSRNELHWKGTTEIGQTHVVKAVDETRHAPKVIAQREAELLFTPGVDVERKLRLHENHSVTAESTPQRLESFGVVYLIKDDDGKPILDAGAQRLVDGSKSVLSLQKAPNIGILINLSSLRLVEEVSIVLHVDSSLEGARLGLHYDDGRNQDDDDSFRIPRGGWEFFENYTQPLEGQISFSFPGRQARYVLISLESGRSSKSHWGLSNIEISGRLDGLSPYSAQSSRGHDANFVPMTRSIDIDYTATKTASFIPLRSSNVRVAVYTSSGNLIGVKKVRDPSKQRAILDRQQSNQVDAYSESIWSVTLPYNWVDEGHVILIGCIDNRRPTELLVHRLELNDLAQFSEHTVTRTKLAIFGDNSHVARLESHTHEAKRLARNLYSVVPVAELKWADTDLWHLPYLIVMGKEGPVLVNSEEERRSATEEGTEISWSIMKNELTIRHSLAQTGFGLSITSESGQNSPYASGTSVFMGWSLSKQSDGGELDWEDLGYWDTLAAAAWTGWCALKAGDECSNYFVHELGHAQSMEHFDKGTAVKWGIEDEYPRDGQHMAHHPWGFDSVERKFRTLFDFQGDGKLDPLNGAGEDPTSEHCFSQYTPYQVQKSQEWAHNTPILLSAASSSVPIDGAYKLNRSAHRYVPLTGSLLSDTVGEDAMQPLRVGVPVVYIMGTIGRDDEVCQIYPPFRSRLGNTFKFPDPFSSDLPPAFFGSAYYIEVNFIDGTSVRGLIAVEKELNTKSLKFFSFNVGLDLLPISVGLYRFTDEAYPEVSSHSAKELLYLRPLEFPSGNPLEGVPPILRVGRGWLGGSTTVILDRFCVTADDCSSDRYSIEWRADVGSENLKFKASLTPEPQNLLGATVFKVPVVRQWDSSREYSITVLITRFSSSGARSLPLLDSPPDDSSDDIDVTHSLKVVAPWEMNESIPGGTYHSIPGVLKVSAEAVGSASNIIDIDISLSLSTITEQPTSSPSKLPAAGPSQSPIQVRWYIDWRLFTCVTDGESTEWAPAYVSKLECCESHMGYDVNLCLGN